MTSELELQVQVDIFKSVCVTCMQEEYMQMRSALQMEQNDRNNDAYRPLAVLQAGAASS
jgi:hypothetical protein